MELFRRLREFFQSRRTKKTKQIAEMKEKLEHMEKVVKDLDAFNNLMIEKITEEKEEKAILLQTVQQLEATLAPERKQQEQDITERSQSWAREQKQLEERVAQLEVTLRRKKGKKAKLDMKKSNNLQLQTTRSLQDSLNHSEEKKCADHQSDHLRSDRERLEQRLALLGTTLNFEQNKFEKEIEMIKLDMEEMITIHFQTIRELQDSLNHCELTSKCVITAT
ncbi:hypothetical protein HF521_017019 [Silurus meridionalis]|uniref:Uncharacterized protein n=1 Tax=Silurus meridionalis TaxID=175797 RepID=A0A8T0BL18_SILME|nr:hypothetical protein HF521_017019 [Silurus meridionalis]